MWAKPINFACMIYGHPTNIQYTHAHFYKAMLIHEMTTFLWIMNLKHNWSIEQHHIYFCFLRLHYASSPRYRSISTGLLEYFHRNKTLIGYYWLCIKFVRRENARIVLRSKYLSSRVQYPKNLLEKPIYKSGSQLIRLISMIISTHWLQCRETLMFYAS